MMYELIFVELAHLVTDIFRWRNENKVFICMTFQYTVSIEISITCMMIFLFIIQRYSILTIKCCYYILN